VVRSHLRPFHIQTVSGPAGEDRRGALRAGGAALAPAFIDERAVRPVDLRLTADLELGDYLI
jgi:hypothetical protein